MPQLPLAWMGILALGILWTNALLVFFAAWKDRNALAASARAMDRTGKKGTITSTRTASDAEVASALACFEVVQVGRAADATDVRTILFHDKSHRSSCLGGSITCADGTSVDLDDKAQVDVWVEQGATASATKQAEASIDYATAYEAASKGAGYTRTLRISLTKGEEVFTWLTDQGTRGLSTFDPRKMLASQRARVTFFMAFTLLGASVTTAVSLVPPALGTVSKLGGLLGLAYFLGITPMGVSLRERIRKPSLAFVRGAFTDPERRATPRARISQAA